VFFDPLRLCEWRSDEENNLPHAVRSLSKAPLSGKRTPAVLNAAASKKSAKQKTFDAFEPGGVSPFACGGQAL
jgi:hypothetical protein